MKSKKQLKFWNGRGHGKYQGRHISVCAYSVAEACELISKVCKVRVSPSEIKIYYGKCWGNDMAGIKPTSPCVYATNVFGKADLKCLLGSEPASSSESEWKVKDCPTGGVILQMGSIDDSVKIRDPKKAHLASASPDMYEVLKWAYEQIKVLEKQIPLKNQPNLLTEAGKNTYDIFIAGMVKIENAISKAEGKQSLKQAE